MRFLGIDYGNKRIGISISDKSNTIANPFSTIINTGFNNVLNQIVEIIEKEQVTDIVIGLPLSFNFDNTAQTDLTQKFVDFINEKLYNINVHIENEILSTKEAENRLDNLADKNSVIDQTASSLILQSYLDKNKHE
ncbi:MAG TPA: Holliday junction resolvase RuvX [Candidatus Paceibacterota bacterium]|nr:Holliday junction resolvase RuvX [Candidatus Paceibacterota bacterium]